MTRQLIAAALLSLALPALAAAPAGVRSAPVKMREASAGAYATRRRIRRLQGRIYDGPAGASRDELQRTGEINNALALGKAVPSISTTTTTAGPSRN